MSRTRVRRRRLVMTAVVVVAATGLAGPLGHALESVAEPIPVAEHRYVVRPGDTLWAIAKEMSPAQDPRAVVDAIADSNHIDPGSLVPGQMLALPSGS